MRLEIPVLIAILLGQGSVGLAAPDRNANHAARLRGLDLSHRGSEVRVRAGAALGAADIADLPISSSIAPARFTQDHATVVALKDGGWLTAWDDERLGARKIFWQRYDSQGEAVGSNTLVATSLVGNNYVEPKLAVDTAGRVYLGYRDQTDGLVEVVRYTSAFAVDYGPMLVNDTSLSSFAGPFDLAVFTGGSLVIVWENYSSLGSTINRKVYSPTGAVTAAAEAVNTDGGSVSHWVPAVAVAPGSGFLIAWEDYRNGQADIYARRYLGNGSAVGGDFGLVSVPADDYDQYSPSVAYSSKDRYVIGWVDLRSGQEIYLQRYDQTTGAVGGNTLVSSGQPLVTNHDVNLCTDTAGQTMVMWSASGSDNTIQSLLLDSGLVPAMLPHVVNLGSTGQRWGASSRFDITGHYAAAWTEFVSEDADIALMLFSAGGNRLLAQEATANDDSVGAPSTRPFLVSSDGWWNLVCWTDRRNDAGDIYVRSITNAGQYASSENRVNQDAGAALQTEPGAALADGKGLIVWNDGRTLAGFSGQRIYGRFCDLLGVFSDDEFLISDSSALAVKSTPRAVMDATGRGLVAWLDRRNGSSQVYGRWLATEGSLDGAEFLISMQASDSSAADLNVRLDNNGLFDVIWLDAGLAAPSVKLRRYTSAKALDGSFSYTPALAGVTMDQMSAAVSSDGTIDILWTGVDATSKVYLTRLASDGGVVTSPFEITDDPSADASNPCVSICENSYVSAVWIDRRSGRRAVYYQLLAPGLSFIDANGPVSSVAPEFMQNPMTVAHRGRAWFVWSDPRQGGLNIYASALVYLPTAVDDPDAPSLPNGFELAQNYPNPFNPSTEISFSLPTAAVISLSVYNVLGQRVALLAQGRFPAGQHTVTWNGTDERGAGVASGVYFYRLISGDESRTRKMMLLK